MGGNPVSSRDLNATTPHGESSLNIYHSSMQEALLKRASVHGVDVNRGAKAKQPTDEACADFYD